jgi:GNAT superfamily N-acetyltransferase
VADTVDYHLVDGADYWPYFAKHHYMSGDYNGHGALVGVMNGELAAFTSFITYPSPLPQPCKRGHRTVVLPDFQGFGLGPQISQVMGAYLLSQGFRYFCKTSHHRLGEYRNNSPLWRPTTQNLKARDNPEKNLRWRRKEVVSYSHEFLGDDPAIYERVLNPRQSTNQLMLFD